MANRSKAKGTRAETAVVNYLNEHGIKAERRALSGSEDKGDIKLVLPNGTKGIAEVKTGQQTFNPNRTQLKFWKDQTMVEKMNASMAEKDIEFAILVVVRYRRKLEDADVWMQFFDNDGKEHWCHEYLDNFAVDGTYGVV